MSYIVTCPNSSNTARFPLRGTIIAFDMSRAQHFATREDAQAAIAKASRFMKPSVAKKMRIDEVTE